MEILDYAIPFRSDEVPHVSVPTFNVDMLKARHERCIEILEAIESFRNRKKRLIENIGGFGGIFPELRKKYVNNVDTVNRCLKRLEAKYYREMGIDKDCIKDIVGHGVHPELADIMTKQIIDEINCVG
jgi:hypothetical protein